MGVSVTKIFRTGSIIALDTVIFIYAFEKHPQFGSISKDIFNAVESGRFQAVTSILSLGEILTGAKKAGNEELTMQYRAIFQHFPGLLVTDIDKAVIEYMSDIRAKYEIPTPDAIHLGSALVAGADFFVTNDARLKRFEEMPVILLKELG